MISLPNTGNTCGPRTRSRAPLPPCGTARSARRAASRIRLRSPWCSSWSMRRRKAGAGSMATTSCPSSFKVSGSPTGSKSPPTPRPRNPKPPPPDPSGHHQDSAIAHRLATSTGGVLTGRGADIIAIDDPLKPEEALSEAQRQAANEWYDHTLYSRQNDKQRGAIVITMQRLQEDDLIGHVLAQEQWEVLSFPAIAEADEEHRFETIWGVRCFRRRRGDALHPDREPLDILARIRGTIGEYQRQERFDRIVQSWDTANKATELSDFSVCTTWGVKGKDLYLLAVFRRRLEYPVLKRAVREQQGLFGANEVLIEDKASGTQLIQELIADGCHGVTRYQPTTDKIMRLHAQTAMIENGFVHIPEASPWLAEYLHEITVFPNGKHDDQVDSTAQFLDWCNKPMPCWGIYELTRRQAEKLKPPEPVYVRLEAPPGIGAVQTLSGRHITIGEDRIVEMTAADADCLIRAGWTKL